MTQDLKLRMGGLLCLLGAVPCAWFFMLRPLQQARAGAPEIDMSIKGAFILVPLLAVMGVAFLVGGEGFRYRDTSVHPPKPTALGLIVFALAMAAGGLCFWYMHTELAALGYQF